jgi:hypothetical protein
VCFKDFKNNEASIKEPENNQMKIENSVTSTENKNSDNLNNIIPTDEMKVEEQMETKIRPVQSNTHSCWICNKKVGYLGFKCKCEYVFCGAHRHFSDHNCDFDYKSYDREKLVKKGNNFGETAISMSK